MKLTDITKTYIMNFSDSTIFHRGEDYYSDGLVSNLQYDADNGTITADVSGTDEYYVEINEEDGKIDADCDCPYEGYPCKHIVAVMLEFSENKDKYVKKEKARKKQVSSLEKKLSELSKDELIEIIMACTRKYTDFKNELMVRFADNKQKLIDTIRNQVDCVFPSPGYDYSTRQIAKTLKNMAQAATDADDATKVQIYWIITDRILDELNEYGMQDEPLEDIAIDHMRIIAPILKDNEELKQLRMEVIRGLMEQYETHNMGITDFVYEAVHDSLTDRDDYQIVIDSLESMKDSSGYHRNQIAELYEELGDDKASLKILEANLHYGMDYWRLAQYWIERKQKNKALEIVKEGIKKGEGRKEELYDYMREQYEQQKDYDAMLKLFESKLKDSLPGYYSIGSDPIYKSLMKYYESTNDYESQVKFLELRFSQDRFLSFGFYKEAQDILKKEDWPNFENRFIAKIEKTNYGERDQLLAEIYDYRGDTDELMKVISGRLDLLRKYENKLISNYTNKYLESYQKVVGRLIASRGRENYQTAAQIAGRIKEIYLKILKKPEDWDVYIRNLRESNKSLRAMQEEFQYL